MLTIDHLEKCFGSTVLFRDLTFTVDGPAVLWAPSGWGKTTLLRILMGLETPTAGRVQGAGRVSAVFQEDRLCPQLTAVQNVLLVLPDDRQEAAIRQDFARLWLDEAALALPARKLSGGQKRRTALLRALWARGTPCCWTSPLPVWTRLPCRPASPCCGSGWRAVRCCWPPTTVPPSTHWAGRCWSCRSWHSRVRLAIPQTKDYNKG